MFTITMGVTPDRLTDLSVFQMVDHVEYLNRMREVADGG